MTDYDLMADVENAIDDVKDAARKVRACDCEGGYRFGTQYIPDLQRNYSVAFECSCMTEYRAAAKRLNTALKTYKRKTREDYPDYLTRDMTQLSSSSGSSIDPNKARTISNRLADTMGATYDW